MFYEMEGKTVSPPDIIASCESAVVDRDSRTCTFANSMSVSGQQSVGNERFGQLSFPVMTGKELSMGDGICDKACGGRALDQRMLISSAFTGDVESNSRLISSTVDENRRADDASLVDLKLGRFPDHRDFCNSSLSRGTLAVFSSETSAPPKRARGASSQTPYCQVYGCNKDLSSSKGYHKRHKVCEVHSKTSKVIVNGIQQRFCQQCSRFQLLSEFDDGKRSCRKRLADHNERRRKPQVGIHSGRPGRVLQSYNGGIFQGSAFSTASFVSEYFPPGGLDSDKYEQNDLCRQIKVEDGTNYCSLLEIQNIHGCLDSKSIFSYGYEKQFSDSGAKTATGSIFSDSGSQYQNDLRSPNSGSLSLFRKTWLGNDEYNVFDTASTGQVLSGIPDSGCAPSLLSSLSRNSSSHLSGIPVVLSLVKLDSTPSTMNGASEKLVGVSSQASFNGLLNNPPSSALSPNCGTDIGPILISDSNEVNSQIPNEIGQRSEITNSKQSLSCEGSPTNNLLQFSSPLHRVEHQSSICWGSRKLISPAPCESLDVIGLEAGSKGWNTKLFRKI